MALDWKPPRFNRPRISELLECGDGNDAFLCVAVGESAPTHVNHRASGGPLETQRSWPPIDRDDLGTNAMTGATDPDGDQQGSPADASIGGIAEQFTQESNDVEDDIGLRILQDGAKAIEADGKRMATFRRPGNAPYESGVRFG